MLCLIFHYVLSTDAASNKLQASNVFTMAKRTVDGQDMLYQSMKLTNGIWVLAELKGQTGSPNYMVSTVRHAIVEQSGQDLKSGCVRPACAAQRCWLSALLLAPSFPLASCIKARLPASFVCS